MNNKLKEHPYNAEFFVPQDRTIDEMIINSALRDRRIFLNAEVDRDSIFKVMYFMDRIKTLDEQSNDEELKPIEIIIDSYGGFIYHGLALISKIEQFKSLGYKIITTVHSVAMSMGFMILIVGSERRSLKYSRILCHQPSSSTWGTLQDMEDDVEETKELWNKMKEIIINYTKITDKQLEDIKIRKHDWSMWAEEALELGVVDAII